MGPTSLIVDLIPELKLVIGEQAPIAHLSPQDAQRRFQAVLRRFIGVFAELASHGTWKPSEKDFFRKDGSRVPVLVGGATFGELQHQGVAFVVDLSERKRAEADLAHANRVATMGQLTASRLRAQGGDHTKVCDGKTCAGWA